LLGVFAHPDDETFLAGPVLAKYAHEDVRVELVIAAPGERRSALECAARVLGIGKVHVLDYVGSSMSQPRRSAADDSHSPHPADDSHSRHLAARSLPRLIDDIARVIAGSRPDVVLVDSPYGAYGHPDHILVHRAAIAALGRAAPPTTRLYALAFPMPLVRLNLHLLSLSGVPVSRLGPDGAIDLRRIVAESHDRTGLVDVTRYVSFRRKAAACYEDEIRAGPVPLKLFERSPLWLQTLALRRQAVTRIRPPSHSPAPGERRVGRRRHDIDLF
jgi:LmbE family N-acetylglucosaminyl deacetylase